MTLHLSTSSTNNSILSRTLVRGLAVTAATALLVAGTALSASAAPGDTTGITIAHVEVADAITLYNGAGSFYLRGIPQSVVYGDAAVQMYVWSNSSGYKVTVQAAADRLVGTGSNTNVIPISALQVRESGSNTSYNNVSETYANTVHTHVGATGPDGDAVNSDYLISIPFVSRDSYTVNLNYIVSSL